jgi:hypothetical protein
VPKQQRQVQASVACGSVQAKTGQAGFFVFDIGFTGVSALSTALLAGVPQCMTLNCYYCHQGYYNGITIRKVSK